MSTPSPALLDALDLLSDDLYSHLDEADSVASQVPVWSDDDMESARQLIVDLVQVIRNVLIEHQLQSSGECQICESAWPCPTVMAVHTVVKDPQRHFVPLVRRTRGLVD